MRPEVSWYEKGKTYVQGSENLEIKRNIQIDEEIRSGVNFVEEMPTSVKLTSEGLETDIGPVTMPSSLGPSDAYEVAVNANPFLSYEEKFGFMATESIEDDPAFPNMDFDENPDRAASYLFAMGMEVGRKSVENADEDDYNLPNPDEAEDSDELQGLDGFAHNSSMSIWRQKNLLRPITSKLPFTDESDEIYGLEVCHPAEDRSENEIYDTLMRASFAGAYLERELR